MSNHLEPLSDSLFSPLSLDEQNALMGGLWSTGVRIPSGTVYTGTFTYIGVTQVNPTSIVDDYKLD
jgi:hypothetical protein